MSFDVLPDQNVLKILPVNRITERLSVRRLSASGIERLKESIQRSGFLENFPLLVTPLEDDTYQLIEGNHRYEAALLLGLTCVPCLIKTHLTEQERYTLALQSNRAAETVVPSTLVTYAEFISARSAHYTQQEIADMLGWSRGQVSQYALLKQRITDAAWNVIATTFDRVGTKTDEEVGAPHATTVALFSERLLRLILDLTPEQQLELVTELATSPHFTKGHFKSRAENYRARNEMYAYALPLLGALGEEWITRLSEEIMSGHYDADWKTADHPKLQKLLASLRDEWERKHSIRLIHSDFYEVVAQLEDGCIDLLLTDPPYHIARENTFVFEGRAPLSQDFGPWDKQSTQEFMASFEIWAREWARLLREQGSGYVFTSDRYLSHLRDALERAGLHVKATIVWHKTNPGPQVVKTNFKSSMEYLLFFTKGEGGHTFNWQGDEGSSMHNFVESAICGGTERVVDAKGKTLHPTQKPEHILRHFLEISSNRGDTVLDCFAGVGSTGAVAKQLGRKFIGIEQDNTYFEAMQRRLAE